MPIDKPTKKKILTDFELMKEFEVSTGKFYLRACSDPAVTQQEVKDTFQKIADDETRHADIVQKIINIINSTL
jgi:rubrerythrin